MNYLPLTTKDKMKRGQNILHKNKGFFNQEAMKLKLFLICFGNIICQPFLIIIPAACVNICV